MDHKHEKLTYSDGFTEFTHLQLNRKQKNNL